jgi:SAM-dependent methyltransferase
MAENLGFDREMAKRLEVLYASGDVLRRRRLARRALAPVPGDRVVDIGCGPGYYVDEIAVQVGPGGRVIGVDPSTDMLAVAEEKTARHDNVTLLEGEAMSLPVEDGWADRALCVQVLEYVDDVPRTLDELHRAVRPGGTVVVWDIDWATLSWHSGNPERMARVLRVWDDHLAHPSLPRTLATSMRAAGFEDVRVEGYAFVNRDAGPNSYAGTVMPLIAGFVKGRSGISETEAAAWMEEQLALSEAGDFFCSLIQYCFTAIRA